MSYEDQVVQEDVELEDEEETFYQDIDVLQNQGINVADIKKLKASGICTVKGLQMTTRKKLNSIKGLSEGKVDKIREATAKVGQDNRFLTALDVCEKRKHIFKINTGSEELNKLIGGGIESMAITEVFGEFRTGKTQLSHTLCVTCQIPGPNDYPGGKALFIDTENTFRPERLKSIADRFNLDHMAMLQNIIYIRALTSEHQYEILDMVAAKFHEEGGVFRLLVVDSIMALFRVDYSGRGELADRQQKLAQMLSKLQKISEVVSVSAILIELILPIHSQTRAYSASEGSARQRKEASRTDSEYNVAVFITNQMTSDPGAAMSFQADPKKPVGGHILAHASTTRISLRKGRGEARIAKVYDSPDMPESECTFAITTGGIADFKE